MRTVFSPAIQARLVLPLVGASAQHQPVFYPDTAAGQVEPSLLKCLPEIQSFGVGMKDINRAVLCKSLEHLLKSSEQECRKFRVGHMVILNAAGGFRDVDVIRWVSQNQVCGGVWEQGGIGYLRGSIAAEDLMHTEMPEVAGTRTARLLQFCIGVVVVFLCGLRKDFLEELFDFRRFKSGYSGVDVRGLDVLQQLRQHSFIPLPCNFVEGKVQGFFLCLVQLDDHTGGICPAQILHDRQPLMSTNDGAVSVDDDGVDIAERLERLLDLLISFVPFFQLFARVISGRGQGRESGTNAIAPGRRVKLLLAERRIFQKNRTYPKKRIKENGIEGKKYSKTPDAIAFTPNRVASGRVSQCKVGVCMIYVPFCLW